MNIFTTIEIPVIEFLAFVAQSFVLCAVYIYRSADNGEVAPSDWTRGYKAGIKSRERDIQNCKDKIHQLENQILTGHV